MKKLFTLFALMLLASITSLKAQEFQKVTSASELSSGDVIIIGCSGANCYAGPMGTNTFLTSVESQADALRITLGGGSYGWTLTTSEGTIGATAVKKLSSTSGTTTWNISFEDGDAFITSSDVACGSIQYNPSAPRFTCYTSTQSPVQIYKSKSVTPPDDTSEFEFEYNSDGTATVTGGPQSGDIVIPSSVSHEGKTYSVTSIGSVAFYGCSGLTSITIPNSVTSIGNDAFYRCSGLTSITIPNSVTSIGGEAFSGCKVLTSITIPNSVTSIGEFAFSGCSSLTSINVQAGNTKYDSREKCNAIIETASNTLIAGCKNTVIPNSVTIIGEWAFDSCSGLTSVTIPSSVTSIGRGAFEDCPNIQTITSLAVIPPVCEENRNAVFDSELFIKTRVFVPNTGNALARYLDDNVWGQFRIYERDLTGVDTPVMNGEAQVSRLINLNGQYITNAQRGIAIEKLSNGTTKKVLMR